MSEVFWIDLRAAPGKSMIDKLDNLLRVAGMSKMPLKDKFTVLKIHVGEPGNMAYIRPPYVKVISNLVKELGGKPYLSDSNTLYSGKRSDAYDHMRAAQENGFSYDATGCDFIVADGIKGQNYVLLPVEGGIQCNKAMIGCAIADADAVISVSHFKGHELTGFGGALKNLGMGAASRAGKNFLHEVSHPLINRDSCIGCGVCVASCASKAVTIDEEGKASINHSKCVGCCQCVAVCTNGAARASEGSASKICGERIVEYTKAILSGKPNFHISFVMNVSPNCDCWGMNDAPIVADIGIFASFDPVALDQACADAVNNAPAINGTVLSDKHYSGHGEKFGHIHPDIDWRSTLEYAEKLGLGKREYTLTKVTIDK